MTLRITTRFHTLLGVSVLLAGCGGDPNKPALGRVSGTVTYQGKPLTTGVVTFVPSSGPGAATGQAASGEINGSGGYSLSTFEPGDGAVLGVHTVTVQAREGEIITGQGMPAPGQVVKVPKSLIPERYAKGDTSKLQFEVKPGSNTYNIELTP
ncbi:MAG: hypothetical protein LC745_05475 [Planctomycetia bacterium]|nr:hypothetical protein [Planctomycetia bacterium]